MGEWCVVFMSDWRRAEESGNLHYEELGFGFKACCCFHVRLKESWRNWELALWGIWVLGLRRVVVFMSDWRRADEIGNLHYEELGFGFKACCCFHVRLKESWNKLGTLVMGLGCVVVFMSDWRRAEINWELWLWVWGVLLFSCQIEGELKQFELGGYGRV